MASFNMDSPGDMTNLITKGCHDLKLSYSSMIHLAAYNYGTRMATVGIHT